MGDNGQRSEQNFADRPSGQSRISPRAHRNYEGLVS